MAEVLGVSTGAAVSSQLRRIEQALKDEDTLWRQNCGCYAASLRTILFLETILPSIVGVLGWFRKRHPDLGLTVVALAS